jgi:hypothetical protein
MYRINVHDADGGWAGWFDHDVATVYREAADWDGSNHISRNTRSMGHHEVLYRTAQGRWVLAEVSDWQGELPWYRYVKDEAARRWLILNDHDEATEQWFGPVEEERGPGRPEIGPAFSLRFPADLLARTDERAKEEGISRAEYVRRAVEASLA